MKLGKRGNKKSSRSSEITRMSSQPRRQRQDGLGAEERGRLDVNANLRIPELEDTCINELADTSINEHEDTCIHEAPTGEEIAHMHGGREIYELRCDKDFTRPEHRKKDQVS